MGIEGHPHITLSLSYMDKRTFLTANATCCSLWENYVRKVIKSTRYFESDESDVKICDFTEAREYLTYEALNSLKG